MRRPYWLEGWAFYLLGFLLGAGVVGLLALIELVLGV